MKFYQTIGVIMVLAGLAACESTDSSLITEEEAQQLVDERFPVINNIAFIDVNDQIFYVSDVKAEEVVPVIGPAEGKEDIRVNDDGSLMAYMSEDGYPVIVDREGNTVERYSNFSDVKGFGWTNFFKSFYIFSKGEFNFFGEPADTPELTAFEDAFIFPKEVLHVSLSQNGDVIYIFRSGFRDEQIMFRRAGAAEEVEIEYTSHTPKYGTFTVDNNLLIGFYSWTNRGDRGADYVRIYEVKGDGEEQLDYIRDFNNTYSSYYRNDIEYLTFISGGREIQVLSLNGNDENLTVSGYQVKSFDWW